MNRYEHNAEAFWQFLAKKMKLNLSFYIAFLSEIGVSKRLKFDEDWRGFIFFCGMRLPLAHAPSQFPQHPPYPQWF